jgi:hypothetical protein
MKACNCADGPDTMIGGAELEHSGAPLYRRLFSFIGWIVPAAILALIPKCPVCLAGYAVIGTSVGFSLSAFAQFRLVLIGLCLATLAFLGTKSALYVVTRIASKRHS